MDGRKTSLAMGVLVCAAFFFGYRRGIQSKQKEVAFWSDLAVNHCPAPHYQTWDDDSTINLRFIQSALIGRTTFQGTWYLPTAITPEDSLAVRNSGLAYLDSVLGVAIRMERVDELK